MKSNADITKGWILKAENDIFALKIIMESGKALDMACFHAQQAAEKYLKAFLCFNGIDFPKTHNIEELLNLCTDIDKLFSDLIKETAFLTEYAVALRYDFDFLPDKDELENALVAVNKIRHLVLSLLPEELHP
jgi:HEPN domain-containing protein